MRLVNLFWVLRKVVWVGGDWEWLLTYEKVIVACPGHVLKGRGEEMEGGEFDEGTMVPVDGLRELSALAGRRESTTVMCLSWADHHLLLQQGLQRSIHASI